MVREVCVVPRAAEVRLKYCCMVREVCEVSFEVSFDVSFELAKSTASQMSAMPLKGEEMAVCDKKLFLDALQVVGTWARERSKCRDEWFRLQWLQLRVPGVHGVR